jgi:hypothetical protein
MEATGSASARQQVFMGAMLGTVGALGSPAVAAGSRAGGAALMLAPAAVGVLASNVTDNQPAQIALGAFGGAGAALGIMHLGNRALPKGPMWGVSLGAAAATGMILGALSSQIARA